MKRSDEIIEVTNRIAELIEANPVAAPNEHVAQEIRFLEARLIACDIYASEKAGAIATMAEMFYSAEKHLKYSGGAKMLYTRMIVLLDSMRRRAEYRRNAGD